MNILKAFKNGLSRTRNETVDRFSSLFRSNKLDPDELEDIEEALIEADLGIETVDQLIEKLTGRGNSGSDKNGATPSEIVKSELISILGGTGSAATRLNKKPWVIMLVGVNGSGKTTTAGKLAAYFRGQNKSCVIAAADTFRAAAVEQLEIWSERAKARIVKQRTGADAASVVYDAYQSVIARGEDVLIVDTAGRLHANRNLMEELAKLTRVLKKSDANAPHEVLLVIDATTGQNGVVQAREFTNSTNGTGIIITKLDGTARGGVVIPIRKELGLPIEFVCLGEKIDDLYPFQSTTFVDAILHK